MADTLFPSQKDENPVGDSHSVAAPPPGVLEVLSSLVHDPYEHLIRKWNWKSAVLSSLFRAAIFFFVNLKAGLPAAFAALETELVYRALTSGFYGSLTEAFREAEPPWAAFLAASILLPIASHSLEFMVHWARGTRRLLPSIVASVIFTVLSTLFNLYAMRRGALIVGKGGRSLREDLLQIPRLVLDFICFVPKLVISYFTRLTSSLAERAAQQRDSAL